MFNIICLAKHNDMQVTTIIHLCWVFCSNEITQVIFLLPSSRKKMAKVSIMFGIIVLVTLHDLRQTLIQNRCVCVKQEIGHCTSLFLTRYNLVVLKQNLQLVHNFNASWYFNFYRSPSMHPYTNSSCIVLFTSKLLTLNHV